MIGTTRSRVNFFMNKFRKLGFIEYDGKKKRTRQALFTRVEELIHQILFNSDVMREHIPDEMVG